jgi:hypothetical protein
MNYSAKDSPKRPPAIAMSYFLYWVLGHSLKTPETTMRYTPARGHERLMVNQGPVARFHPSVPILKDLSPSRNGRALM